MTGRAIGSGTHSGPWTLLNDNQPIRDGTGRWMPTKDTAANPATQIGEDEHDVCFNSAWKVPWAPGSTLSLHGEITNPVLHEKWKSGFDALFSAAPSAYLEGWAVWDEYHDHQKRPNIELHPLREIRFEVPGNAEYRCLLMDTSGRFGPDEGTGEAHQPWSSQRTLTVAPRDGAWLYRSKVLERVDASYQIVRKGAGLESTASLTSPDAALVLQSKLQDYVVPAPVQATPLQTVVVTRQGAKMYRYQYQVELVTPSLPSPLRNQLTWQQVPSVFNGDKYGYHATGIPERILVDLFVSSAQILNLSQPFGYEVEVAGEAVLTGANRTLPLAPPFDAGTSSGPSEAIYVAAHMTFSFPRPWVELHGTDPQTTWSISEPSIGFSAASGWYRKFQVVLHDFPQPAGEPSPQISWEVLDDTGAAVSFQQTSPSEITLPAVPAPGSGVAFAPGREVEVRATVIDAIGTVYKQSMDATWYSGTGPMLLYDIGLIEFPRPPESYYHLIEQGTPLTVAAARAIISLRSGEAMQEAFEELARQLHATAQRAREEGLGAEEAQRLTDFFSQPGRGNAETALPERVDELSRGIASIAPLLTIP